MVSDSLSNEWKFWEKGKSDFLEGKKLQLQIRVFVFCAMFNGIFYFTINRINSVRDWQYFYPEINLDSSIPFVWWTIVPYAIYYVIFVSPVLLNQSESQLERSLKFTQLTMLPTSFCFLIFVLIPVEVDLRDQVDANNFLAIISMNLLHGVDTAWNGMPSLHIVHSSLYAIFFIKNHKESKTAIRIMAVLYALIVISTLTTKQHYILDVLTGLLVSFVFWKFVMSTRIFTNLSE